MKRKIKISPSILSCDFSHLADEIVRTGRTTAEYIHIDVMDGVFVRNLTLGAPIIRSFRKYTDKIFDVHLMITEPIRYIDDFADAGADIITVHAEACSNIAETLLKIREKGIKTGLAIKPYTDPEIIREYLPLCDMVLVMSVEPGFAGQGFIEHSLDNVRAAKRMIAENNLEIDIEIDGGISESNAALASEAGVSVFVAGSAVYKHSDISAAVERIRSAAMKGCIEK